MRQGYPRFPAHIDKQPTHSLLLSARFRRMLAPLRSDRNSRLCAGSLRRLQTPGVSNPVGDHHQGDDYESDVYNVCQVHPVLDGIRQS
jgi:hypothetical protein